MIAISEANDILDKLLRDRKVYTYTKDEGITTINYPRYLGFSSTIPSIDYSMTSEGKKADTWGKIVNFTEPKTVPGYRRLLMTKENLAALSEPDNAEIKNKDYNLSFPVPDKDSEYGKAVAIGFFNSDIDPEDLTRVDYPYYTAELKEEVTLGKKSTLVIYKDDFSVKLTSEKAADSSTG